MMVQHTLADQTKLINHAAISIKHYVCQHSSISNRASQKQMYSIILSSVTCMALLYFAMLSQKTIFKEGKEYEMGDFL